MRSNNLASLTFYNAIVNENVKIYKENIHLVKLFVRRLKMISGSYKINGLQYLNILDSSTN